MNLPRGPAGAPFVTRNTLSSDISSEKLPPGNSFFHAHYVGVPGRDSLFLISDLFGDRTRRGEAESRREAEKLRKSRGHV